MTKILCTYKTAIGSKILPRVSFEVATSKQTKCTFTHAKIGKSPIAASKCYLWGKYHKGNVHFWKVALEHNYVSYKKPPSRSLIWEYVIFRKTQSRCINMLNPNLHKKKRFGGRNSVPQFLSMVGVVPSHSDNFPS